MENCSFCRFSDWRYYFHHWLTVTLQPYISEQSTVMPIVCNWVNWIFDCRCALIFYFHRRHDHQNQHLHVNAWIVALYRRVCRILSASLCINSTYWHFGLHFRVFLHRQQSIMEIIQNRINC